MSHRSLFGLNLLTQFFVFLLLAGFADQMPPGLRETFGLLGTLLFTSFLFGMFYGIFRLLGARSEGLEWFYQRFPCGFLTGGVSDAEPLPEEPLRVKEESTFDWKALCSFRTLRFAGVALIITAAFSLLFNIEWQLIHKILVAAGLGVVALLGAEWTKRKGSGRWPALLSVIGFTLLQFSLTLLSRYAIQETWSPLLQSPNTWLTFKFLLTSAALFTLWRYPGEMHPHLYFAVAYVSPLSLLYVGSPIDFPIGLVFAALLTAIVLAYGTMHRTASLWILNAIAANAFTFYLYIGEAWTGGNAAAGVLALIAFGAFFVTHLTIAVAGAQTDRPLDKLEYTHVVLIHVIAGLGILALRDSFQLLRDYHGFAYVALGLASFFASFAGGRRMTDKRFRDVLANLAIILSTIGLFLQTTGPWSSIAFLLYACAVLWLSLRMSSIRTRIYGFIILLVSLVKLYMQFSEIFKSIPGSLAVLGIGVILVALSYKFEALKDLVMHGLPAKNE